MWMIFHTFDRFISYNINEFIYTNRPQTSNLWALGLHHRVQGVVTIWSWLFNCINVPESTIVKNTINQIAIRFRKYHGVCEQVTINGLYLVSGSGGHWKFVKNFAGSYTYNCLPEWLKWTSSFAKYLNSFGDGSKQYILFLLFLALLLMNKFTIVISCWRLSSRSRWGILLTTMVEWGQHRLTSRTRMLSSWITYAVGRLFVRSLPPHYNTTVSGWYCRVNIPLMRSVIGGISQPGKLNVVASIPWRLSRPPTPFTNDDPTTAMWGIVLGDDFRREPEDDAWVETGTELWPMRADDGATRDLSAAASLGITAGGEEPATRARDHNALVHLGRRQLAVTKPSLSWHQTHGKRLALERAETYGSVV